MLKRLGYLLYEASEWGLGWLLAIIIVLPMIVYEKCGGRLNEDFYDR